MNRLQYEPHNDIDAQTWLALDESERIDAVKQYHQQQRVRLPNKDIHAMIHVIVENQVALGDEYPARSVLSRLMTEGLDRHEAIHAIGSVLTGQVFDALKEKSSGMELNAQYLENLNRLTAESWRKQLP